LGLKTWKANSHWQEGDEQLQADGTGYGDGDPRCAESHSTDKVLYGHASFHLINWEWWQAHSLHDKAGPGKGKGARRAKGSHSVL